MARKDEELLVRLAMLLPCASTLGRRTRDTNFRKSYETSVLSIFDRDFREQMQTWGLPVGRKSRMVKPPDDLASEIDYVRGLVDGDGSLGLTGKGHPFLSLNTSSDAIADFYLEFLHRMTGRARKVTSRNKRDDVYNIAVFKELAQVVTAALYYDGCLALARKSEAAEAIREWARPVGTRRAYIAQRWSAEQDDYIRTHSLDDAMIELGRTRQSVQMRLWRLRRTN